MMADLEFNLESNACPDGNGHQWSYVWAHHPSRKHRRIRQYLGRKQLPEEDKVLLDRVAEQIDKKQRAFIGGVVVLRLCESRRHGSNPRLERLAAYAVVNSLDNEPLSIVPEQSPKTTNGWGTAQMALPGARILENVIYLARAPIDVVPFDSVQLAGAARTLDGLYVAMSGTERIVLPSQVMLDAASS